MIFLWGQDKKQLNDVIDLALRRKGHDPLKKTMFNTSKPITLMNVCIVMRVKKGRDVIAYIKTCGEREREREREMS